MGISNARSSPSILEAVPWLAATGDRLVWGTGAGAENLSATTRQVWSSDRLGLGDSERLDTVRA